ncbi:hypothetical protein HOY82DRAFT_455246, partial [Tuber indicum]
CSHALIAGQKYFRAQRSQLPDKVEAYAHLVFVYLKPCCELYHFGYFWCAVKLFTCKHCRYKIKTLLQVILLMLGLVSGAPIWRFWRHLSHNIMEGRRSGVACGALKFKEFVLRTYTSHGRTPE